jgi:hypothetical protein
MMLARLFDSAWFRVLVVWAVVFGTYNRSGWSVAHFEVRKLSEFYASTGLGTLAWSDLNPTFFFVAIIAGAMAMYVGNLMHRGIVYGIVNIGMGFLVAMIVYVLIFAALTGTFGRLDPKPAAQALVVGAGTLFVWYFFYKMVTEIMSKTLFALSFVFFGLLLWLLRVEVSRWWPGWDIPVDVAAQVVTAMVLSFGVNFAGFRRRMTGVGSIMTPDREHEDHHHAPPAVDPAAADTHH